MAALTATKIADREPVGKLFSQIYSVPIVNIAAADEWFVTDFSFVEAVTGISVQGATDRGVNVVVREQGTSGSETADNAAVGVEGTGAATVHFTVRGRP